MASQDFTALKTPPPTDNAPLVDTPRKGINLASVASALRVAVLLAMGMFIFGNIATWAPLYELQLIHTFTGWWNGYPHGDTAGGHPGRSGHAGHAGSIMDTGVQREIWHTGHTEMVRPTFLFLFCILPFFLGVLLIEALRFVAPARRATSTLLWSSALVLRRKPTLPFLGVSRFTLGEWLFGVIYVIGGNVLCFWYQWDRRIDMARDAKSLTTTKYWNIIGISNGYVCIYNMAFLLLPVTRNSVWMEFFNISYANGVKLHRWMGFAAVITGVIHTVGYWVKWVRDGTWQKYQLPCFHCDITVDPAGYYPWFNTFGLISVAALVLMIPTSLPVVRRKVYEWFYISHWVLFIISFFFAILHWGQILWWVLPAGLLFFVSRAASSWNGIAPVAVHRCAVIGDEHSGELVELVIERLASDKYDYKAGNFVYVNLPALSKLQWHALTIASSPRTSATHVTLLIKPLGDWSQQLVAHAKECVASGTKPVVYVDGFYGASLEVYDEYETLCLVGGGIGVTPLLAVLEHIAAAVREHRGDWVAAKQPRVVFALAFRELALLRAVAPVVLQLKELDPTGAFFQTVLSSSQQANDAALDAPVVAAKATDKKAMAVETETTKPTRAFYEPLRSSSSLRVTLFVVLYAVAVLVVTGIRWGNGAVQGDNHPELWPLQRSVEALVLCATIAVAYAFIYYEYLTLPRVHAESESVDASVSASMLVEDVHSVRDLAARLGVVFGERLSVESALQSALTLHQDSSEKSNSIAIHSQVGVMISGPVSLKDAANEAVVALGRTHFDVHEEEFEL